tara:strand:+ start:5821 stop:7131 length:1311 start_codon:yes stop_codon:yes gene_type:complete
MSNIKMTKTFCALPWVQVATYPDGSVPLCCMSQKTDKTKNLNNTNLEDLVNSDQFKQVRLDMLKGKENAACKVCYNEERSGLTSYRMNQNEEWNRRISPSELMEIVQGTEEDGTIPFNPYSFDLRLGNTCNLKCVMCQPQDSSKWVADNTILAKITTQGDNEGGAKRLFEDKEKYYDKENYEWYKKDNFLKPLLERSKNIQNMIFAGGEPLFIKEHRDIIKALVASGASYNIQLNYHTNGTVYDEEIIELWSHFKHVSLYFSLDSMERVNRYVRYPSMWNTIVKNMHKYDQNCPDNMDMSFLATISNLSIWYLPEFMEWITEQNYMRITFKNGPGENPGTLYKGMVHWPELLSPKVLPQKVKDAITKKLEPFFNYYSDTLQFFGGTQGIIETMNSEDLSYRLPELKEYLENLDNIRNLDYKETFKELIHLGLFDEL